MKYELLPEEFVGIGEVKGFQFKKIAITPYANVYEVKSHEDCVHYEVFERKFSAVCVDFDKRLYSETDFKEVYPKGNTFGINAYTCLTYEQAMNKMQYIEDVYKQKEENVR